MAIWRAIAPDVYLHRTVVAIRDCILILFRYAGHQNEAAIRAADGNLLLQQMVRLALVWSAKTTSNSPSDDLLHSNPQPEIYSTKSTNYVNLSTIGIKLKI